VMLQWVSALTQVSGAASVAVTVMSPRMRRQRVGELAAAGRLSRA